MPSLRPGCCSLFPVSSRLGYEFGRAGLDGGGLPVLAPSVCEEIATPPTLRNFLSARLLLNSGGKDLIACDLPNERNGPAWTSKRSGTVASSGQSCSGHVPSNQFLQFPKMRIRR